MWNGVKSMGALRWRAKAGAHGTEASGLFKMGSATPAFKPPELAQPNPASISSVMTNYSFHAVIKADDTVTSTERRQRLIQSRLVVPFSHTT